jgi:vibriolysin
MSMKRFTLVLVLSLLLVTSSWAAKKVDLYKSNANGYIKQLNQNGFSAGSVFGLGQDEDIKLVRSRTDFNGITHHRYSQTYKGIPVWGMQTVISKDRSGKVVNLNGNIIQGMSVDIQDVPAGLDPQGALQKMKNEHMKKDASALWNFENETYGTYIFIDEKGKGHLAYVVSFFADTEDGNPSQFIYFIDAKNGKVLHSFDMLRYAVGTGPGGNQKIGYYYYGTDYPGFGVTQSGSTCTMNTTDVKSVNLNHGTSGSTAYSYTCYENTFQTINGAYSPINDAQYFGQVVYDMYQDWYGVAVLPFQLMMRVHYSTNYENAFWNGSSMTFGDGYTTFYPLVALDVSAHEVSHGFTDNNSNLTYSGQSGGINEAFSDMAGEAAKFYMRGTNDFKVGYDIFKSSNGALRYMYNPPLDGRSIDNVSDYYSGLDVHYSSGIFNKAFYLIATSPGWDTQMAFDIFTKANIDYWTAGTNFQQGAEGAQAAAADYGYPCQDVADAFAGVGITLSCGGGSTSDMYVKNITQNITRKGSRYRSTATVTIWDTDNQTVSNATVYITWSGVVSGSASGVTGSNGTVSFTSSRVRSQGPFTITVTNVTHTSKSYNSSLNVETSDSASY